MDLKIIHEWADKGLHKEIISEVEKIPKDELSFDLNNQLARAYNNISEYDKAIKILLSQIYDGKGDAYWNYVIGYAFYHKNDKAQALRHFEKSFELGRNDTKYWLDRCNLELNGTDNCEILTIAEIYKDFGFNISCISKKTNEFNSNSRNFFKTPSHKWNHLFNREQKPSEFDNYDWANAVGIGTFTNWKNLVVLDIDGCSDISFIKKILNILGLPENYEWVIESGSKNGFHIYYRGHYIEECDDGDVVSTFPPKQEFEKYVDKIEFLWRTHSVLPPSVHGAGNKYSFVNVNFPKKKPVFIDDKIIYNFINTFLDFEEIVGRGEYGGIIKTFSSKADFINEINENADLTKHFLDEVYLIIDIETSGLPVKLQSETKYPEIIQISWVLTNKKGVILKKHTFIIDTPFIRTNNNSEFLNIDFDVAKKVKFSLTHALKKLAEDIKICDYIVAHNIEFDIEILGHYFIKNYGLNPFSNKKMICTMKSTVNFCKIPNNYGYKYPKLSELYFKLFGYQVKNSHNAEVDVLHTLKCFKKLKTLGEI